MPDKPLWLAHIPEAIQALEAASDPWVDRATLEGLLHIGRRRAQQLLAPLASRRAGSSFLTHREALIAHLKRIAAGEQAYYDDRRREQLWKQLNQVRKQWLQRPPVLVELPNSHLRRVERHDFDGLPDGVELTPGTITLSFREPEEALQKLLALAIAIGENRQAFEERVALPDA